MKDQVIGNEHAGTGAMSLMLAVIDLMQKKGILSKDEVAQALQKAAKDLPNEDRFASFEMQMKNLAV